MKASKQLQIAAVKEGLTIKGLAEKVRIHYARFYRYATGQQEPALADAVTIEAAVGIRVESWPSLHGPMRKLLKMRSEKP